MSPAVDPARTTPRAYALQVGLAVAAAAVGLGALLGFAGAQITVGALAGGAAAALALSHLEIGLWAVIAIITLLPFGGLPFKVVFTPTFLDLAMSAVVLVYAVEWMTGRRRRLTLTPVHGPIAVFMALMVFSFTAGLPNGPLTSNLIRQFGEMLVSILFVFVLVDYVRDAAVLQRLVRALLLGGALAAVIGIGLYLLPDGTANRALSALRVVNYPAGDVLRYVEDNPANPERAISTSVDPNALGGLLAMLGALAAPQLLTRRPVFGSRWAAAAVFGVIVTCLVLTFSRGAMAALALGLVFIALARYRRMAAVLAAGAALVLLLPVTQDYVVHFLSGLQGQDLATQMRFGEYKDALTLISRYPWLGVGFAGAPEIDLYLGVSNAYLLIASKMGLVGLSAFLAVVAGAASWAWSRSQRVFADEGLTAAWLGLLAGLAAALAIGLVDHYFFNLAFQAAGALFWMFFGLCLAATRLAEPL